MKKACDITIPTYEELYADPDNGTTWSCGWKAIDCGNVLHRGEVTVVFSHMRKVRTDLGLNLVSKVLEGEGAQGNGVLVYSVRQSAEKYAFALASLQAGVHAWNFAHGLLPRAVRAEEAPRHAECVARLQKSRLYIEDRPGLAPEEIVGAAETAHDEGRLGLIVIDALQDLGRDGAQGWCALGCALKRLAGELNVPVLVLAGAPLGDITFADAFRGYGNFYEYADRALALVLSKKDADTQNWSYQLKPLAGLDTTPVEITMNIGTGRLVA